MLTKAKIKFIQSLKLKKNRKEHGCFVAEGVTLVQELLQSDMQVNEVFYTQQLNPNLLKIKQTTFNVVEEHQLQKASLQKSHTQILALVKIPELAQQVSFNKKILVIDSIQDPGNFGTIIRTADWFGIQEIVCSLGTVDAFNPKVIQASMGSISRVKIRYTDLDVFIEKCKENKVSVYASVLKEGENLYDLKFESKGALIIGNEGAGIREKLVKDSDYKISIPRIGKAESLNAAIATAIICSEMTR